MKLIVGLGNPGKKYAYNRHNIGFMQLDYLAAEYDFKIKKKKFNALFEKTVIDGESVVFVKPQTYMNLSGKAVRFFRDYFKVINENILIVYDDIHLPFAKFRLRRQGSAGGHNGVKSIIMSLNGNVFDRLRIGVDKPDNVDILEQYVLSDFTPREKRKISGLLSEGAEIILSWLKFGAERTMMLYN